MNLLRRARSLITKAWRAYVELFQPEDVGHGVKCVEGPHDRTCIECEEKRATLHRW